MLLRVNAAITRRWPPILLLVRAAGYRNSRLPIRDCGGKRMEEFLAALVARLVYMVVEALIVRLTRAFMAPAVPVHP
jgi:hypothetical protein